jgi:uncharacterized protein
MILLPADHKYHPEKIRDRFLKNRQAYKKFLAGVPLKKWVPRLAGISQEVYQRHDCLACAACCKNYSPRFKAPDLKRISKYLGMKETELMDLYLHRDEDGDYVLKTTPCVFLGPDNRCSIYEVRPSDCQRFPYIDEDVFLKRKELTLKNLSFCPIAQDMLEKMMELQNTAG